MQRTGDVGRNHRRSYEWGTGRRSSLAGDRKEARAFLLEDCAQCAGGSIGGKRVGTFGDMGIFSFQMNNGGAIFDNLDLCRWGRGYRLDQLRAAVLVVQLKKLPTIIACMPRSQYRIRQELEEFPQIRLRKMVDPSGGTGCFLIVTFQDAVTAVKVNRALRAEGIVTSSQGVNDVVMTDWGLHIYSNIVSLVNQTRVEAAGFPWRLAENAESKPSYAKRTCPVADSRFERSILLAIPSCLTELDEDDIIRTFCKVLGHVSSTGSWTAHKP